MMKALYFAWGLAALSLPVQPAEILVVGTLHQRHASNPSYSYEDVARILDSYDADVVCVEIRPQDFRRKPYLREMELATIWALARHRPVYPIDSWPDSPNDREVRAKLEKTPEYQKKAAELAKLTAANPILTSMDKKYPDMWRDSKLGYEFWNGKEYQTYTAEGYRLSMQVYGDNAMNLHYQSRNEEMVQLILAAVKQKPVRKVVVLTGAEHKHFFDRALQATENMSVVDFSSLLPLKAARPGRALREFLEEDNDLPYFEPGYPSDLDRHFDLQLVGLLHGPDMDFHPETIPPVNIFKAEAVMSRWQSKFPGSYRLRVNLAWYAFLIGRYPEAIGLYEGSVKRFEKGEITETIQGVMAYQGLGRSYDLTGDREKALGCYATVEKLVTGTPWERVKKLMTSMDQPYRRASVFQPGRAGSKLILR